MLDTRAVRKEATRERILAAAWRLASRDGLAALSFREVAAAVGMRAPSLYTYFDSKNDLYDAMFAEAAERAQEITGARAVGRTPDETLRNRFKAFIAFAAENPMHYQLMVQRPVPGFEPSRASFSIAIQTFSGVLTDLAAVGITDDRAADMWRSLTTGLMTQQISNEPGGTRWVRLADDAVDMFLAHFGNGPRRGTAATRKGKKR